jgi:hypothetical protein
MHLEHMPPAAAPAARVPALKIYPDQKDPPVAPTYRSLSPGAALLYGLLSHLAGVAARLADIPAVGWAWGLLLTVVSLVWADIFPGIFLLTVLATLLDHAWGVRVVRETRPQEYDPAVKRKGRDQKLITLQLLLLIRGAEGWAATHGLLDVAGLLRAVGADGIAAGARHLPGVLSGLVCCAVFVDEVRSFHEHRLALGGKPLWPLVLFFGLTDAARSLMQGRVRAAVVAATPQNPPETP